MSRFALSTSEYEPSSGTRLKSEELLECPSVFFSRSATSFAGDTRVFGTASSSMVCPRRREEVEVCRDKLRSEIEMTLRSRRFCHGVQRGFKYAGLLQQENKYIREQPWPIATTGDRVG